MFRTFFLCAFVHNVVIHAETITNRRGFTYDNATIKEVQTGRVKLAHDSGIGWVKFEDLHPDSIAWIKKQPEFQQFKEETDRAQATDAQQAMEAAKTKAVLEANKKAEEERKKQATERSVAERNDAINKEYQKLSGIQILWVSNFRQLEKLLRIDEVFPGSHMFAGTPEFLSFDIHFIASFGKPDRERNYDIKTTTYENGLRGLRKVPGPDCRVRELTYSNRLLNPTTEGKEDLTVEFYNGFYHRVVASPSGNSSR